MQRTERRNSTEQSPIDSAEVWSLQRFIETFEPHITPELLVNILIEILGGLEAFHRSGRAVGVLDPDEIMIFRDGHVELHPEPGATKSTPAEDLFYIALLFQSILRHYGRSTFRWRSERQVPIKWRRGRDSKPSAQDTARIHPVLKEIFARACSPNPKKRYTNAWQLRAALLDFLSGIDVSDSRFYTREFVRDPVEFNRELGRVISERECERVEMAADHGQRRRAVDELQYLLEVAPGNPKALSLLRVIRQGRQLLLSKLAYMTAIVALLLLGGSIIMTKLRVPLMSERALEQPLVIERADPLATPTPSRGLSSRHGFIDIAQEAHAAPTLSLVRPGLGKVELDLDDDARAYFDAAPGVARPYGNGQGVWLTEGRHTITIVKAGYPQAISSVTVNPGHVIELTARATTD